jgi:hypothetical protein
MCILSDLVHGEGIGQIRTPFLHIYNMCALLAIGRWSNLSCKLSDLLRGKHIIFVDESGILSNPVTLLNGWLTLQSLQLVDDFCSLSV